LKLGNQQGSFCLIHLGILADALYIYEGDIKHFFDSDRIKTKECRSNIERIFMSIDNDKAFLPDKTYDLINKMCSIELETKVLVGNDHYSEEILFIEDVSKEDTIIQSAIKIEYSISELSNVCSIFHEILGTKNIVDKIKSNKVESKMIKSINGLFYLQPLSMTMYYPQTVFIRYCHKMNLVHTSS
jgi:hypothetical protein